MTADTSDRKCRTFSPFKFGLHPPRHFSEIFLSLATARFSFHRIICTKSWIGWDYAESRGFETIEVDSSADLGVKIPIREQRLLCPIRSQHFFREFETNYNYTGSLC